MQANLFLKLSFLVLSAGFVDVCARTVSSVTQPIGRLVRTYNTTGPLPFAVQPPPPHNQPYPIPTSKPIKEMNYICAQWDDEETTQTPPFDVRYPATEVLLTKQQHFVRLLGSPKSGANGAWIMRSEYVRGKTPDELRDIFALPDPPIAIVNVEMPASPDPVTGKNYALWTGIAGPIRGPGHDWGDGGSVQNRLVADFAGTHYFPTYGYTSSKTRNHRQPIGEHALAYQPRAGCGNAGNVACYLDTYIPVAYSDFEEVYTALDYLNYIGYGPEPLRNALCQIGPQRYDAVSFLAFRNAYLFSESILQAQVYRHWQHRWLPCDEDCDGHQPYVWVQAVSEFN